jgi:precorrin-3B C17-methyltransferase
VVTSLAEAPGIAADMATLIIVGSAETRLITRAGRAPLVYTPRRAVEKVIA